MHCRVMTGYYLLTLCLEQCITLFYDTVQIFMHLVLHKIMVHCFIECALAIDTMLYMILYKIISL